MQAKIYTTHLSTVKNKLITLAHMSNNLQKIRKSRGFTQVQLAKEIGTNNITVSRYENGERELTLSTMLKIKKVLGCTIAEIAGEADEFEPSNQEKLENIITTVLQANRNARRSGKSLEDDKLVRIISLAYFAPEDIEEKEINHMLTLATQLS